MRLTEATYGPAYMCEWFPWSDHLVYAHADGRPLGTAADSRGRFLRHRTHELFDQIWQECDERHREYARRAAYEWLRMKLGIARGTCHIGQFDEARCIAAIKIMRTEPTPDLAKMHKKLRKRNRRQARQDRLKDSKLDGKTKKPTPRFRIDDVSGLLDSESEADDFGGWLPN